MLTRHLQTVVLLAGLVSAIIGIFFAKQEPYTGIAAGAASIACAISIWQSYRQARDARHSKEMLQNLVRSSPSSKLSIDKLRELVISKAKSHGFIFRQMVSTRSDSYDPEADTIFVFRSPDDASSTITGILVIPPATYSDISTLPEKQVALAVEKIVNGKLSPDLNEETRDALTNSVLGLASLANYGEGFSVKRTTNGEGTAMTLTAGKIEVSFVGDYLRRLCAMPAILRDLSIAKTVNEQQSSLAEYIGDLGQ
jgi:hypothetical protein